MLSVFCIIRHVSDPEGNPALIIELNITLDSFCLPGFINMMNASLALDLCFDIAFCASMFVRCTNYSLYLFLPAALLSMS